MGAPPVVIVITCLRRRSIAGRWRAEGDVSETENGPASRWASDEHAEWLPGERFLVNRWDAKVGDKDFRGMAVFGCDDRDGYFATFYDNAGNHPTYTITIEDNTWSLTGTEQRATYEFAADGQSIHVKWEMRGDQGWQPLCDLTSKRIDRH